jgi:ribonuclease HI
MDRAAQLARRPDASTPSGGAPAGAQAWRAWFDGSAHPNPGRIGIGALLLGPDGQRVEISRHAGHGNSGDAEYLALTALLEAATQLGIKELRIFGDSQVVVNDVQPDGGPGAKGLEAHRARVMELLAGLGQVSVCWVPRHRNGAADRLSQLAASAPPDDMQAAPHWRQP